MANAPHTLDPAAPKVELHIRHMPGGKFTDVVFSTMKEKDILRIEGPYGSFYLREDSQSPIILLASGTGFAPIKALIEHMQHKSITRPATLYWGGRRPADLYMNDWVQAQVRAMPHLTMCPWCPTPCLKTHGQAEPDLCTKRCCKIIADLSAFRFMPAAHPLWWTLHVPTMWAKQACQRKLSLPIHSPRKPTKPRSLQLMRPSTSICQNARACLSAAYSPLAGLIGGFFGNGANGSCSPPRSKPIRLVVPYAPGGPIDVTARALAERVKDSLGVVIIDNKPGAGGNLGVDLVAKAPADGYTIGIAAVATHAINPLAVYQDAFQCGH
jgi:hypothetical protein